MNHSKTTHTPAKRNQCSLDKRQIPKLEQGKYKRSLEHLTPKNEVVLKK